MIATALVTRQGFRIYKYLVTTIVWDEPKRLSNLAKHGFDFAALDEAFFLAAVVVPVTAVRYMAIGRLAEGTLAVVFAYAGSEGISII